MNMAKPKTYKFVALEESVYDKLNKIKKKKYTTISGAIELLMEGGKQRYD